MRKAKEYHVSIRAYFPGPGNYVNHHPTLPLKDIPKWIDAYQFTHPNAESISIKIWLKDEEGVEHEADQ